MDKYLKDFIEETTPKFNPVVMEGLATHYMPMAVARLDSIFKSANSSLPEGLNYKGCEICTPHEEFLESTKIKGSKREFDLAESDVFMIKLLFEFIDEDGVVHQVPPRYIYVPFCGQAGIFRIGGTPYHITGVLSDKIISPSRHSIFVRLIRSRLNFRQCSHSVLVNGERETHNVVWSEIYIKNSKGSKIVATTKANTCVTHYLLVKYGFSEMFRKYAGVIPQVFEYHPSVKIPSGMVVCRSSYIGTKARPEGFLKKKDYQPNNIALMVPEENWNHVTASFVAGFFYIADNFPDRVTAKRIDDTFLWSVLLGHIIFSGSYGENTLYERINDHINSLDFYLELIIKNRLAEIGWYVDDFYDLIAKIQILFPNLILGNEIDTNSMYSKHIEILYHMLYQIASKIFLVSYHLRKAKLKKPMDMKMIKEAFTETMSHRTIFEITKNNMIVDPVSYCGDHMYPKITSKITEQEAGSAKFKSKEKKVQIGPSYQLHSSMMECGNVLFLSKANVISNGRINPFVNVNLENGTFIRNPKYIERLNDLQVKLTSFSGRKTADEESSEIDGGKIDDEDLDVYSDKEYEDEEDSDDSFDSE